MEALDREGRRPPETPAGLACERCKRRKIKCDRAFPACRSCLKASGSCLYPITSQKPGPKPGAPQKRRQRASIAPPTQNMSKTTPHFTGDDAQPLLHEDQGITITSKTVSIPNTQIEQSPPRGLPLSQLVHPSHDPVRTSTIGSPSDNANTRRKNDPLLNEVFKSLHISEEIYQYLLHSYFQNMTAFSLFHHPSFERKILAITSHLQLQALIAALFSFSARFNDITSEPSVPTNVPSHLYFRKIAKQSVEQALKHCSDDTPPLCLLQALVLVTFDELIRGVRGCAWRLVGKCVRIAYELQLHLIDKDLQHTRSRTILMDPSVEEKRRVWWVIWEFDVFASTIRRLPTAIDWTLNATWLPVNDDVWFADGYILSCHLDPDASLAWKYLQKCGNQSPKAWFIVINALMRSAHGLSYPQAYPHIPSQRIGDIENLQGTIDILSNSLYCLSAAIPSRLAYQGEYLAFSRTLGGLESLQLDSARHSIHIMIQLSRFMINHYQVFDSTSRQLGSINSSSQVSQSSPAINQSAWNHYLAAASEIVTLVRSCSPRHVSYVNPFLSSTIWLAAAAQIVSKHVGQPLIDPRIANSNLDLLQTNLNAFVSIWEVSSALQQKLVTLETRLVSFGEHAVSTGQRDSRGGELDSEAMDPTTEPEVVTFHSNELRRNGINANVSTGTSQPLGGPTSDWSFQTGLDVTSPRLGPVAGLDLWGWGLEELLSYNV